MKKSAFFLLAGGLVCGFFIGRSVASHPSSAPASATQVKPDEPDVPASKALSKEQALLLQAIHELDLTTAELDDALNYIEQLERNNHRYNWLLDFWKKNEFGTTHQLRFGNYSGLDFSPSTALIDFFGWDEEQVEQMKQVGNETAERIKEWESEHATLLEESENNAAYQISGIPDSFTKEYLQSMAEIMDPEDFELLSKKMEKSFLEMERDRSLTLSIGPPPADLSSSSAFPNKDQDWITVKVKSVPDPDSPFSHGGTFTSLQPYTPGETILGRWNHILKMEGSAMEFYR